MDKRYQVFVSSTFEDLQDERKTVIQALLESDCIPAGMELFPASNEAQWSLIKDIIDDSDYYLLIIGGRYGSTNEDGKSYTQMEYEYAKMIGKPIIAFIHKNPDSIPSGKSEKTDKGKQSLEEFKKLVQGYLVKYWETPSELASEVVISLHKLVRKFPAEGWVKAGNIVDEASIKEIARLQEENRKLRELLESQITTPPKGTEFLAQGEDRVCLRYMLGTKSDDRTHYNTLSLSWNKIFSTIAPSLVIYKENVNGIHDALNKLIKSMLPDEDKEFIFLGIDKLSVGTILIQLKALGYIKSDNENSITSSEWELTSYGDYALTQLVAAKKYY